MRIRSILPLLLLLVATVAEAQFRTQAPACTVECPAGPPGPQGPPGPRGPQGPPSLPPEQPVCAPVPHRDLTMFDATVSALIETASCDAHLVIFRGATQTAYLLDLRAWRYQQIDDFMPGHPFTGIEAMRNDPHHLVLKDRTGFWTWRWPWLGLPWHDVP